MPHAAPHAYPPRRGSICGPDSIRAWSWACRLVGERRVPSRPRSVTAVRRIGTLSWPFLLRLFWGNGGGRPRTHGMLPRFAVPTCNCRRQATVPEGGCRERPRRPLPAEAQQQAWSGRSRGPRRRSRMLAFCAPVPVPLQACLGLVQSRDHWEHGVIVLMAESSPGDRGLAARSQILDIPPSTTRRSPLPA